jgi:plasmid maintenance system antidote protein VapI
MNREEVLRHPAYWFENEQNEIFRQVSSYMEKEGINKTQLAERLKVDKSHVSQILSGNYNFSLKKWIDLCLAIGIVPNGYKSIEEVINEDLSFASERKTEVNDNFIATQLKTAIDGFFPLKAIQGDLYYPNTPKSNLQKSA